MFIDSQGNIYQGDLQFGDRVATDQEVSDWMAQRERHALDSISVSPWQFRKALNISGLRALVEQAVALSDQDTQDGYAVATEFKRNDPIVLSMAAQLGKSQAEMDEFFLLAATL